ncbi:MAG: transcriptional regulator [Phenylobacterium zucineum]|nr:MAG: transcriptional regulator [Phenylobacterium zucineum]
MFIHPWDAAQNELEWQTWLAGVEKFGVLAVNNADAGQAPIVLPTHFTFDGPDILVHFARPNPAWPSLEAAAEVRLAVTGDYAFIPGHWRVLSGGIVENGVPTSYYASVQFVCAPTIFDDPVEKAAIIAKQTADFQPEGMHAPVTADSEAYGRMLSGTRAVRLRVLRVDAKFKFDDHKSQEFRAQIAERLDTRNHNLDASAAEQQRRRLREMGDFKA